MNEKNGNGDNSIPMGDDHGLIHRIAGHMTGIMRELNLDLDDPNFIETPERVAKMYLEMFHGLREGAEPKVTTFPNEGDYHHMVKLSRCQVAKPAHSFVEIAAYTRILNLPSTI